MARGATAVKTEEANDAQTAVGKLISEFEREYGDAWIDVQIAAEMTSTAGWRQFYAHELEQQRKDAEDIVKAIEGHVARFKDFGSNEESEKELSDCKKLEAALRERIAAWEARVVYPVKKHVDRCNNLLGSYISKAADIAREAPLLHKYAAEEMREAQKQVGRATWNDEDGTITVQH